MEAGRDQARDVTENWMPARLIPVAGIRGQEEQEIRGASSLLAVMTAVDEFGRSLAREMGAPAGRIQTYTEVPLKTPEGKTLRPDGVIAVERGTPLADVLRAQAQDVREEGRRNLMEKGGKKEIGMMIPVVFLVLPITVLFAVFPGFDFLNFSM